MHANQYDVNRLALALLDLVSKISFVGGKGFAGLNVNNKRIFRLILWIIVAPKFVCFIH